MSLLIIIGLSFVVLGLIACFTLFYVWNKGGNVHHEESELSDSLFSLHPHENNR